MFASLVTNKAPKYRGLDRACDLYTNAKIGVLGKVDDETEAAWLNYIDLLGAEPIACNDKSLSIMKRIIDLCKENEDELEIVLFTKMMNEPCDWTTEFAGYDVAGANYSSILPETACRNMPAQFAEQLNGYGLFDSFEQASKMARYANSLTASAIEPDFPYAPVKVYIIK